MAGARFELHRDGQPVADGIRWPDGSAAVHWRGRDDSWVAWRSMGAADRVHTGAGSRIVWLDDPGS
jgi:hypothetical protein